VVRNVLDVVAMRHHPHLVLRRNKNALGRSEMRPLLQEAALLIENLNPVVLAVADVDSSLRVDPDRMRSLELARPRARGAPREQELAVFIELHYAMVAISIGHEKIAIRGECDISRTIERLPVGTGLPFVPPGLQQLAL